jgi:hypothetical protein
VVPRRLLTQAAPPAEGLASLVVERASRWRAAGMRGALIRGEASVYVPDRLRSGRRTLEAALRDAAVEGDAAVLRLRTRSVVWWRGWTSGTVGRA